MLSWLEKFDRLLERAERGAAVGLNLALIAAVVITILARNIFQAASYQLLELSPHLVLWLALTGALLALKRQRHIKIELLLQYLPRPVRRLAGVATGLFAMGVTGLLAYGAVGFTSNEIILLGARGWLALCFPLFFVLAFIRSSLLVAYRLAGGQEEAP